MRKYLVAWIIPLCAAGGVLSFPAFAQDEPVEVKLKEWDLGFKEVTIKGSKARFEIENAGTVEHAFEVEGEAGGQEVEFKSPILKPAEKFTLEVELPPGKYEAYCPVHDHKDKGMKAEIAIAGE